MPDAAGQKAARALLEMVGGLTADDLVVALISGGGSALLTLPAPGIDLAQKQDINRALLACGAPIDAMNTVRKHLSAIKGRPARGGGAPGAGGDAVDLRRAGRRSVGRGFRSHRG